MKVVSEAIKNISIRKSFKIRLEGTKWGPKLIAGWLSAVEDWRAEQLQFPLRVEFYRSVWAGVLITGNHSALQECE